MLCLHCSYVSFYMAVALTSRKSDLLGDTAPLLEWYVAKEWSSIIAWGYRLMLFLVMCLGKSLTFTSHFLLYKIGMIMILTSAGKVDWIPRPCTEGPALNSSNLRTKVREYALSVLLWLVFNSWSVWFPSNSPLRGEKMCVCSLRSKQLTLEVTLLPTGIATKCQSVMDASDCSLSQARVPNLVQLGFCTLVFGFEMV